MMLQAKYIDFGLSGRLHSLSPRLQEASKDLRLDYKLYYNLVAFLRV